jgi:hypothetical protein
MKKLFLAGTAMLMLAGCTGAQVTAALENMGVSVATATKVGTIDAGVLAQGSLFCSLDQIIAVVPTVSVINASAAAVAMACKDATLLTGAIASVAVPVPPPVAGTPVPIASVPPATVAMVAASVVPPLAP